MKCSAPTGLVVKDEMEGRGSRSTMVVYGGCGLECSARVT